MSAPIQVGQCFLGHYPAMCVGSCKKFRTKHWKENATSPAGGEEFNRIQTLTPFPTLIAAFSHVIWKKIPQYSHPSGEPYLSPHNARSTLRCPRSPPCPFPLTLLLASHQLLMVPTPVVARRPGLCLSICIPSQHPLPCAKSSFSRILCSMGRGGEHYTDGWGNAFQFEIENGPGMLFPTLRKCPPCVLTQIPSRLGHPS